MKLALASVEYKAFDSNIALITIPTSGLVSGTLVAIPQGDEQNERDGRQCTITSIWVKGHLQVDQLGAVPTIATNHEHCSVYLILDKQANQAAPVVTDFLQNASWESFRKLENVHRFKILWKLDYAFAPIAATDDGTTIVWTYNTHAINKYIKVQIPIDYTGTTGAIGTIKSNNILLISVSEKGVARMNFNVRVRYVG